MADAAPVCDVLREAMEYLSKLGSNLRVRSESLKEKRLRKEKLKNVHAVQKAAGKVLLICELSKKSIENVEVGVKKILTQIDASQASVDCDGKSIEKSGTSNDIKYEYFEYESRKLKMRDKVNIKHYTSVKVLAKPMSTLMQEKYPVYYKCKLYRLRKKERKDKEEPKSIDSNNVNSDNNFTVNEVYNTDKQDDLSKGHNSSEDKKSLDECDVHSAKKDKDISNNERNETYESSHTEGLRKKIKDKDNGQNQCSVSEKRKKFKHIKVFDSSDSETETHGKNVQENKEKTISDPDIKKSVKDCNETNKEGINKNETEGDDNLEKKHSKVSTTSEKNNDQVYTSNDVQDSRRESDQDESELQNEVHTCMPKDNDITLQAIELNNSSTIVQDDIRDNTEEISGNKNETRNTDDKIEYQSNYNEHSPEMNIEKESICAEEINESTDNSTKREDCLNKVEEDEKDRTACDVSKPTLENENSQSSNESKPFIKCVNINKLLRKDKLPKTNVSLIEITDSDSDKEKDLDFKKYRHKGKSKLNKSKSKLNKRHKRDSACSDKDANKTDDEDYWIQKRKEVKLFKPKKFVINVTQLPKFTLKYLHKNNLRKITQNGLVICEAPMETENENQSEDKSNKTADINTVKNALLNESDTDNVDRSKHALLNDSDSENNTKDSQNGLHSSKNQENRSSDCEKVRSRKNSKSKSRSNTPPSSKDIGDNNLDNNKIKSALLYDSTDDSKTPTKKRKILSDELSPPRSKRKHIMESMHAKKMLLTYSSSSDTDDEQLRNALKEIRDTLLKGNSSDEDNHEKEKESENTSEQCAVEPSEKEQEDLASDNNTSVKDTNSQVDENIEEKSNTCSEKVRSQ
ncbi:unnamed protein product [Euphydryas editha]|uniref:Uncharacterized protein n=1 Tax=Euphydryas editha TaxID=104508 RepID=A0AAU9U171_EUPED|nr:unnamed protein product [Euphydryas editha]